MPLVFERNDERRETSLALVPVSRSFGPLMTTSIAFAVSALFLLLRARPTPTVRAYFYSGMAFAFANCAFPGGRLQFEAWYLMAVAACTVLFPLTFRFVVRFPDGCAP